MSRSSWLSQRSSHLSECSSISKHHDRWGWDGALPREAYLDRELVKRVWITQVPKEGPINCSCSMQKMATWFNYQKRLALFLSFANLGGKFKHVRQHASCVCPSLDHFELPFSNGSRAAEANRVKRAKSYKGHGGSVLTGTGNLHVRPHHPFTDHIF
jgi:hypothetical protein